jgi:putative tryptophan/tyrosine transport system substrate-binding protein
VSNCLSLSGGFAHRSSRLNAGATPPRCLRLADDRMRRRDFFALLGSVGVAWPLGAYAQQKAMPVVGSLSAFSPPPNLGDLGRGPVHQGLSEMGFVEGENMMWEYRWADYHYDRLPALAADLVSRKVDVIIASGSAFPARAAKNATSTIPIVFAALGDPVATGLVASLARPGGNLTGFVNITGEMQPKRLEIICELVPQATVIALLVNPDNISEPYLRLMQEAARSKGIQLPVLNARTEDEIDRAFASLGQLQAGGLMVSPDPFLGSQVKQLVALESRYAIPIISELRAFPAAGGLISYGVDFPALYRQVGIYAGRILKGERPADLPVQQPTTFQFVVNLMTAKALGLTVPPSILARADEVIE